MNASKPSAKNFHLDVSADRLSVKLSIAAGGLVGSSEIVDALQKLNIKRFDKQQLTKQLERRGIKAIDQLEIARGVAPTEGTRGTIHVPAPLVDAFAIRTVDAGELLATITPGTDATPGKDVFGEPIAPTAIVPPFVAGRGVRIEGTNVLASTRGSLKWMDGKLSVEPLREIADVVSAVIDFDGDLHVKRDVNDGSTIRVTGSLIVDGTLGAAKVRVRGIMQVLGGLVGKSRGHYTIHGGVACRFVAGGNVTTLGNLRVEGDIARSLIFCSRSVQADGAISGGRMVANGGIKCATLGGADGTPTRIEVGTDAMVAALLSDLTKGAAGHRQRARLLRAQSEPLLAKMRELMHKEREYATELLAEADDADQCAERLEQQLKTQVDGLRVYGQPEVVVSHIVHSGVTIRIGTADLTIMSPLVGPLRITAATDGLATNFFAVDVTTGQRMALPSTAPDSSKCQTSSSVATSINAVAA